MAVGQRALASLEALERMLAVEVRLECDELDRGALHVRTLRDALELNALLSADGMGLATVSQVALSLSASESRAGRLLVEGQALAELPGALEAVQCGLLTVEQSTTVVEQLAVLDLPGRVSVWRRLQQRLIADADAGITRPPARLAERLRKWVIEHDRQAAEQRRRQAEEQRRVDYRKSDDGLWNLSAFGFRGPELQAILQRVSDLAAPFGSDDDRTADQRRFDALRDLLLGRYSRCSGAACTCRPGEEAPCGAQVQVLVPIGAALGTTDEVAELVGHGPIEPDLLQALLLAAPDLRAVFIDDDGVPVDTGDTVVRPERADPGSLRRALLRLRELTPARWHPRHRLDHPPTAEDGPAGKPTGARGSLRQPQLARAHPPGRPGPYVVSGRLRRLILTRSPRCEFPGCGVRATRCDAEHDRAHPDGPTCSCNLGPLCRRHHQVKQLMWTKTRAAGSAVLWTSATGRRQLSPSQHDAPASATRSLPWATGPHPFDELAPWQIEEELWYLDLLADDPDGYELRAQDVDPDDIDPDPVDIWGQPRDTTWTSDLHDPYLWAEPAACRET